MLVKKSLQSFFKNPFSFALIQLPEITTDYLEKILPTDDGRRMLFTIALLVPIFCITSTVSNACTYLILKQQQNNEKVSLRWVFSQIMNKIGLVIPVALIMGFLIAIGMVVIIPAIYFMAVYVFVPILLFSEPKRPWTSYLHLSKTLAKTSLLKTFLIVGVILLLGIAFELGFNHFESMTDSLLPHLLKKFSVTIFSAIASLCVCHYFFELKGKYESHSGAA